MLLTPGTQLHLGLHVLCFVFSFFLYRLNRNGFGIIQFRTRTSKMASEQNSLGPETNRLNFPDSSAETLSLSRKELETLFAQLFDDSIKNRLKRSHQSPLHTLRIFNNHCWERRSSKWISNNSRTNRFQLQTISWKSITTISTTTYRLWRKYFLQSICTDSNHSWYNRVVFSQFGSV
jgi:hypothetical protein